MTNTGKYLIRQFPETIKMYESLYAKWRTAAAGTLLPDDVCTRCRRDHTDARDVYYPLSDEYIQLCTDCEPDDIAVSQFELWHTQQETIR